MNMLKFIKKVFGYCDCPCHKTHWFKYPKKHRMSTMYNREEDNYITYCQWYFDNEVEPYWKERWEEYYSSRL